VHGLNKSYQDTWCEEQEDGASSCWLTDVMPQFSSINHGRMMTYEYQSDLLVQNILDESTFEKAALRFLEDLHEKRKEQSEVSTSLTPCDYTWLNIQGTYSLPLSQYWRVACEEGEYFYEPASFSHKTCGSNCANIMIKALWIANHAEKFLQIAHSARLLVRVQFQTTAYELHAKTGHYTGSFWYPGHLMPMGRGSIQPRSYSHTSHKSKEDGPSGT
jgi:hypothetical protein